MGAVFMVGALMVDVTLLLLNVWKADAYNEKKRLEAESRVARGKQSRILPVRTTSYSHTPRDSC